MTWMQRLKPVFGIDLETCERCGPKVKVMARIEAPALLATILKRLQQKAALQADIQPPERPPPVMRWFDSHFPLTASRWSAVRRSDSYALLLKPKPMKISLNAPQRHYLKTSKRQHALIRVCLLMADRTFILVTMSTFFVYLIRCIWTVYLDAGPPARGGTLRSAESPFWSVPHVLGT